MQRVSTKRVMSEPLIHEIRPLERSRPDLSAIVPTVDVVIVNWNGGDILVRCVDALLDVAADGASPIRRLVVVDNASSDGSVDHFEDRAKLAVLRSDGNVGYGRGCNDGARGSEADLLLFLNPDVVVNNETIATCIVFLSDPANASVEHCRTQLVCASGRFNERAHGCRPGLHKSSVRWVWTGCIRGSSMDPR